MIRAVSIISIIISITAICINISTCNNDKAETNLQIERIKRESAERKDSISDYYLMVRKKMYEGLSREKAEEFTKKVMDRNDQNYFDSIYFNN